MSGRCLDAGCGEGLYSEFLESFGDITKIVNFDLQVSLISKHRADPRHVDISGSLISIPFGDATFDCCLCSEVIEHIHEDAMAVSELARVLKPGGVLLLSVPTPPAPYDPAHVREGYTLTQLSEVLDKCGLVVTRHAYCFHVFMRVFLIVWRWQFENLGKVKRSYLPRFIVLIFGYADKYLKLARPWDLVVLAVKS
jgi:SAM-dependent methyltransferase